MWTAQPRQVAAPFDAASRVVAPDRSRGHFAPPQSAPLHRVTARAGIARPVTGARRAPRRPSSAQGLVVPPVPLLLGSEHGERDDGAEHGYEPNQLGLGGFLRWLVEPRPIDAQRDPGLEQYGQYEDDHAEQTPAIHDARS